MAKQKNIAEHKLKMQKLSEELKGNLPRVAMEAKVTITTVMRVLNNEYVNWEVIRAAIKVRNKIIQEKLQQQKLLSKI